MSTAGDGRERRGRERVGSSDSPRRRRYSREVQQEDRSEGQLRERLAEAGWPTNRLDRDVGEDFRVQIFDQGTSTGLSFYVRLKSVQDAERRRSKREPQELRYPLNVKDLEHWEAQTSLVVLFVWDVERRAGYWETIPALIKALDARGPAWRKKRTVSVSIPVQQSTDDRGLKRLRWVVADHSLPLIQMRSPIKLRLPHDADGEASRRALLDALDRGTSIVFEGAVLRESEAPAWQRRLYGDPGHPRRVEIIPKPPDGSLPVRIEIRSHEGASALPYVDLRCTRRGRKETVLSNERQDLPFGVEVTLIEGGTSTMKLWRRRSGRSVQEAREAAAFDFALTRPGSRIRAVGIQDGRLFSDSPAPAVLRNYAELARVRLEILEKLAFIEPRIAAFGSVSLEHGLDEDDIATIELLYRACRDGKSEIVVDWSFEIEVPAREPEHRPDSDDKIELQRDVRLSLLGVEIPLGRVKVTFVDRERVAATLRQAIARAKARGNATEEVYIEQARVIEEFLDWPRPADRLYDVASGQAGYFTLTQAIDAGFTAATQVETELRVEPCGSDVFRLVQFPPSEHEDLVILWLQTDQQGVFSHDTALALHQLSDILPNRRHITVPPGWEPPPHVRLDRYTVLHHGRLDPSEITWLGPVPLTKPLRTIRDCMEKGVSPDLMEQAVDEALLRGMITGTEVQGLLSTTVRSA